MTNRSKNKGTAGETAVVRVARANGFPLADRLTLGGARTGHDRDYTADPSGNTRNPRIWLRDALAAIDALREGTK